MCLTDIKLWFIFRKGKEFYFCFFSHVFTWHHYELVERNPPTVICTRTGMWKPGIMSSAATRGRKAVTSYTYIKACFCFGGLCKLFWNVVHTKKAGYSRKQKVMFAFYFYCWIMFLNMKAWHCNENKKLNAKWLLVLSEKSVF